MSLSFDRPSDDGVSHDFLHLMKAIGGLLSLGFDL